MKIHQEQIEVRYYETDQMSIVHHSNYVRYCELARVKFLDAIGLDFPAFERSGFVTPVLSFNLNFKYPAFFGDVLTVKTWIKEFKGVRVWFEYLITNKDGKVLCDGESSHTFTSKDLKPIMLRKTLPEIHQKLYNAFVE